MILGAIRRLPSKRTTLSETNYFIRQTGTLRFKYSKCVICRPKLYSLKSSPRNRDSKDYPQGFSEVTNAMEDEIKESRDFGTPQQTGYKQLIYRLTSFRFYFELVKLSPYIAYNLIFQPIKFVLFVLDETIVRYTVLKKVGGSLPTFKKSRFIGLELKDKLFRLITQSKQNPAVMPFYIMRVIFLLPFKVVYQGLKYLVIFAAYCALSPLLLSRMIVSSIFKRLDKKYQKHNIKFIQLAWSAYAPLSWRLHSKGEKIGYLWKTNTPVYNKVLKEEIYAKRILNESNHSNET